MLVDSAATRACAPPRIGDNMIHPVDSPPVKSNV